MKLHIVYDMTSGDADPPSGVYDSPEKAEKAIAKAAKDYSPKAKMTHVEDRAIGKMFVYEGPNSLYLGFGVSVLELNAPMG
jgi:hypothetical protein